MKNSHDRTHATDRLVDAYRNMLERISEQLPEDPLQALREQIERAKATAVEVGELTAEEAERVGGYLRRDVEDAARYLAETGHELREWYRFDLKLIEARLGEMFATMVDRTRLEIDRIAERARGIEELHTGEVTGAGTLECSGCGRELNFLKPGHIPPCPSCHGTLFRRFSGNDAG